MGAATLERRPSEHKFNRLGAFDRSSTSAETGDIGITPVFGSILALGLCEFGLVTEDGLREFVEAVEQGFQLAVLLRRGPIQRGRFRREFNIVRFTFVFVGKLEVRSVAACGV